MAVQGSCGKYSKVRTSPILITLGLRLHMAMKRLALAHNHLGMMTTSATDRKR